MDKVYQGGAKALDDLLRRRAGIPAIVLIVPLPTIALFFGFQRFFAAGLRGSL